MGTLLHSKVSTLTSSEMSVLSDEIYKSVKKSNLESYDECEHIVIENECDRSISTNSDFRNESLISIESSKPDELRNELNGNHQPSKGPSKVASETDMAIRSIAKTSDISSNCSLDTENESVLGEKEWESIFIDKLDCENKTSNTQNEKKKLHEKQNKNFNSSKLLDNISTSKVQ